MRQALDQEWVLREQDMSSLGVQTRALTSRVAALEACVAAGARSGGTPIAGASSSGLVGLRLPVERSGRTLERVSLDLWAVSTLDQERVGRTAT